MKLKMLSILLVLLCFNPLNMLASSKSVQFVNLPVDEIPTYIKGNELYTMVAVGHESEFVGDIKYSYQGSSKVSYEVFLKRFSDVLKSEEDYFAFSTNTVEKNSKQAIIEVVAISGNNLFSNYEHTIPYEQYTIKNNGKKGVLITGTHITVYTKSSWYKKSKSKVTFDFRRIFKDCRSELTSLPLSAKEKNRLNSTFTLNGLEKKFTDYTLMKVMSEDLSGKGVEQVSPLITLVKKQGSKKVEFKTGGGISYNTGTPISSKDLTKIERGPYKSFSTAPKKVQTKSYKSYIMSKTPTYREEIYVKSKNGKYYYTTDIEIIEYEKGKSNVYSRRISDPIKIAKEYKKEITLLRNEVIKILTSLENNKN
ncbi:hypothetical protein SM124_09085 [Bacillus sp. 31A1R]|uniref:Uncharacterized protein n=1 Tax=Robertmurraya mangrovi TaxID=3098077 RepID=A0ABU5IXM7_9BACI|nr:hypothetical protein [Bacillus sp. 31A1R]MDZ5471900.1 hypothetical protein [Bacillus sp. 31A1R]